MGMQKILILEMVNGLYTTIMTIPWTPDKVSFSSNGARTIEYDIMDLGKVEIPLGGNIRSYKWKGTLPGESLKDMPFVIGDWRNPHDYQSQWSIWYRDRTKLKLIITGTPINHVVYLADYDVDYSGGQGNYTYNIEFRDFRDLNISVKKKESSSNSGNSSTKTLTSSRTYTVKYGDNLWAIARSQLKDETRWNEIYQLNKDAIEKRAKEIGWKSSNNGHMIFPGTVLKLPD